MSVSYSDRRPPKVAGSFYTGDAGRLRHQVESLLADAKGYTGPGRVLAAAVPHAGYVYSAHIAAPVFKTLEQASFDTIVIIGHDYGEQVPNIMAILPEYGSFGTPLGDVPVDRELANALMARDGRIIANNRVHAMEHTIEVQLPFLQTIRSGFKILPVLFGGVTPKHCSEFAKLLEECSEGKSLFVLSSTDLSHYPSSPLARRLDSTTVSYARDFDLEGLCKWKNSGPWQGMRGVETPICSAGGLGTAMAWAAAHGASKAVVLNQGNSGDVSGEDERVVGYASLVFVAEDQENDFALSADTQKKLLALARKVIAAGGRFRDADLPEGADFDRPAAVFVTLTKHGRLRGCIGTTAAAMPLNKAVAEYAEAAAFQDPRFDPVSPDELDLISIEISVLSPMRKVSGPEEIVPGRHGVMVRRGRRSGLFLPQVWEQLPDKAQFLGYLCMEKANLPVDAWKEKDTELYVFTVHAFEEEHQ